MIKSTAQDLSHGAYRLRISLFGYLQIEQDGQPLTPMPGQKVAALLAYLACNPGSHPRRQLAELFWAATPPERLLANLRSTLNRLPKAFKQYLKTTNESVAFEPTDDIWVDVLAFQALASDLPKATAKTTPDYIAQLNQIAEQLQTMVRLYKGAFLEGPIVDDAPGFVEWRLMQQSLLERFALDALRHLVYLSMQQGHYHAGIAHAERLIELDPLDEEARCQLMLLLAYCGEEEAARQVYQALVAMLDEEFGAPPAPETVAAYKRIVARHAAGSASPSTLPSLAQPLIGRATDLATLLHQLQQPASRLVTITGLGGMGKTYLAVEAARRIAERRIFLDGVVYVALAGLPSAARLPETLLQALGLILTGQDNLPAQICAYLAGKELLLIFDNFDHLLERSTTLGREQTGKQTAQQLVLQILQTAPQVKLLVTSRQPLSLSQEQLFPLGGLSLPPLIPVGPTTRPTIGIGQTFDNVSHADCAQGDAIQLFQQAALRNDRAFALTPANQGAVYRFCQWVQGMPLAIVLGAAQMGFLTPEELLAECQANLDLLESVWADLPERQRGVRAIFTYSWQQLDEGLKQIFQKLAVFQSGFTLAAARQVVGASITQIRRLCGQSLLLQVGPDRYQLHELLRQFGAEKLTASGEAQSVQERYMQFYLAWLAEKSDALQGVQPFATVVALNPDFNNFRQAWLYAVEQQAVPSFVKSYQGLTLYYRLQGLYQEGADIFGAAAQALQPHLMLEGQTTTDIQYREAYGLLLATQSSFSVRLGNFAQALQQAKTAMAHAEAMPPARIERYAIQATSCYVWAECLFWTHDRDSAYSKINEALVLAQQSTDQALIADCFCLRGHIHFLRNHYAEMAVDTQRALAIASATRNAQKEGYYLSQLGNVNSFTGELLMAKGYLEKALQICISIDNEWNKHDIYACLCKTLITMGEYSVAEQYGLQALHFFSNIGSRIEAECAHRLLGGLYNKLGLYQAADQQLAQAMQLAQVMGTRYNQALTLGEQSILENGRGNYQSALTLLQEAATIADQLDLDLLKGRIARLTAIAYCHLGWFSEGLTFYKEALARYSGVPAYFKIEAMAGLAYCFQEIGDDAAAKVYSREVHAYLAMDLEKIYMLNNPFETYLNCYHVLQAQQNPQAFSLLDRAYTLLQSYADKIDNAQQRRSFLENVAVNRKIMQVYQHLHSRVVA